MPTAIEEGVDLTMGGWGGIGAPAGLPEEIKQTLEEAFTAAASSEEFTKVITDSGNIPVNVPADEFASFVESEAQNFKPSLSDQD